MAGNIPPTHPPLGRRRGRVRGVGKKKTVGQVHVPGRYEVRNRICPVLCPVLCPWSWGFMGKSVGGPPFVQGYGPLAQNGCTGVEACGKIRFSPMASDRSTRPYGPNVPFTLSN
eukprot:gene10210-biopygen21298